MNKITVIILKNTVDLEKNPKI